MADWSEKHLTEHDLYLFNEGSNYRLYHKFGAHPCVKDGVAWTNFTRNEYENRALCNSRTHEEPR